MSSLLYILLHITLILDFWMENFQQYCALKRKIFQIIYIFFYVYIFKNTFCCSVTKSCPTLCDSVNCSTPGFSVLPISQSLLKLMSQWYLPTISSSVVPFFSCPQSFPASGPFSMSWFFTSGGQNIGASSSVSVLPMNIQGWFPLRLAGWISLQSNGLSRVFSNTTVQKHQFFCAQPSSWSNSHIHTWPLEKP